MTDLRDMVCGHTKYEGCPPCPCERAVLDAWHAGQLIERATINYEAAAAEVGKLVYVQLNDIGYLEAGRRIVDAAVGEETSEPSEQNPYSGDQPSEHAAWEEGFDAAVGEETDTCDECDGNGVGAHHGTCWQCEGTGRVAVGKETP